MISCLKIERVSTRCGCTSPQKTLCLSVGVRDVFLVMQTLEPTNTPGGLYSRKMRVTGSGMLLAEKIFTTDVIGKS